MHDELLQVLRGIENKEIRSACICALIDTYYQCVIYKWDFSESEEMPYSQELLQPLPDRQSGIHEALTKLIDKGFDVNESDDFLNALTCAVANADEPMVEFLLANGADANTWPDMGELPKEWEQNYYLEDIDVKYMDACYGHDEIYKTAFLRTAQTLVRAGGLREFGGLCLLVDKKGNVSLHPPVNMY